MADELKGIKDGLRAFVDTTPLVAPARKMAKIGQDIMNSDLYKTAKTYVKRAKKALMESPKDIPLPPKSAKKK